MKFHHKQYLKQLRGKIQKETDKLEQDLNWNKKQIKVITEILEGAS